MMESAGESAGESAVNQHVSSVFDSGLCSLGEGPLWHPLRETLIWFDINNKRMFERGLNDQSPRVFRFDQHVSAAAWIDETRILIASESALFVFDLDKQTRDDLHGLEFDNQLTRSNDGRADPWGGFWIGTMGKRHQANAGAIYRYFEGQLVKLCGEITIPNSICFSPDRGFAYYADTRARQIMRVKLDDQGWPQGGLRNSGEVFIDLSADGLNPDGSVVDASGNLWNAQWGAERVACYDSTGAFLQQIKFPAAQISCPAFGGTDASVLFATSAAENLDADVAKAQQAGAVFQAPSPVKGQQEPRFKLRDKHES